MSHGRWGWEAGERAPMRESEHLLSGQRCRSSLLRPRPSSRLNHQLLRTAPQEGAWWRQFAHYAFIEAKPFITFTPWLCPNESPEQGWNVRTLWRLFLIGELTTARWWCRQRSSCVSWDLGNGASPLQTREWLSSGRLPATSAAEPVRVFWANETLQSPLWAFISWPQLWNL